jgi:4'-phosphopantetheinyl transferase
MMAATAASGLVPTTLHLGKGEVHVWRVDLDGQLLTREKEGILSPEERARAKAFVFARDRRRYTVSHWALRMVLARYLSADPAALRFAQPPGEKPRVVSSSDLSFNLSHSGERAVIAVARGREVGIDTEEVRDLADMEALASRCFAAGELASWRGLPPGARKLAFFATWTRKEAYLKALGDGLARPLDSFDVTVGTDDRPRLLRDTYDPTAGSRWTFLALDAGPEYATTLAMAGSPVRVVSWTFSPHEEEHGSRGAGVGRTVHGGGEPGGAVLDLAGGQGAPERMEGGGRDRLAPGVPGPHQGSLDGHAPGELARADEGTARPYLTAPGWSS